MKNGGSVHNYVNVYQRVFVWDQGYLACLVAGFISKLVKVVKASGSCKETSNSVTEKASKTWGKPNSRSPLLGQLDVLFS